MPSYKPFRSTYADTEIVDAEWLPIDPQPTVRQRLLPILVGIALLALLLFGLGQLFSSEPERHVTRPAITPQPAAPPPAPLAPRETNKNADQARLLEAENKRRSLELHAEQLRILEVENRRKFYLACIAQGGLHSRCNGPGM